MKNKRLVSISLVLIAIGGIITGTLITWFTSVHDASLPVHAVDEIQHIINCQDPETGAINDVWGEPTWVVPGEMALATIALHVMGYTERAMSACEYLAAVQDPLDGGWCNHYNYYSPVDLAKHARHAAQVLMAFHWCNFENQTAIQAGLDFLVSCLDNQVGGDGLVRGGKDTLGNTLDTKWLSDNVFAAKVFEYYNLTTYKDAIIDSIDSYFLVPSGNYWFQYKDGTGTMHESNLGWINFAPPMFGLDCTWPGNLTEIMRERLQEPDGAILENESSTKKMPGIGLQLHMALRETGGGDDILMKFYEWLANSSLIHGNPDENGDSSGIIDWVDDVHGTSAQWWERFIDTSAFVVFNEKDFRF